MSTTWILIIVLLIVLFVGSPYTGIHSYGWRPSGAIGIILIIVVVLLLLGHL
jgi:hypothetical protein